MKKKTVEVAFDPVIVKADTFGEFGKWWYAYYKTKVQATTYESYGYTLAKLIETFGSFRLIDIQAYHIEAFLEAAVLAGLSKSYISKCRSMMGKIMSRAEAYGKISKNPVPLVDTIRINPLLSEKPFSEPFVHKKDAYTVEEVKTLFELLPNDKIGHSIRLMLCSGIRTQELLAMEHKHVAVNRTYVRVQQAVKLVHGVPTIGPPKSVGSYRDIPIPSVGIPFLHELCDMAQSRFLINGRYPDQPYNSKTYRRQYYQHVEKCGVRKLSPHCCRHTYVSQLQAAGVSCETIKYLVGHSKIDMTLKYLHVQKTIKDDAVEKLNTLYSNAIVLA